MRSPILINGYGVFIGLDHLHLIIKNKDVALSQRIPLSSISHLLLQGNAITLSTAVLAECSKRGIAISLLNNRGYPILILHHPKVTRLLTNLARLAESPQGIRLIRTFLTKKVQNQKAIIHYHCRSLRLEKVIQKRLSETVNTLSTLKALEEVEANNTTVSACRESFFLVEARTSRAYWHAYAKLIPTSLGFKGRVGRGAKDGVNQLLNYSYALLAGHVLAQMLKAEIDPTQALLHHRKNSVFPLLYDFMEPFRPLADHIVLAFIHRQNKPLQNNTGQLRQAVLLRFKKAWYEASQQPQPWSKQKATLDQLVDTYLHRWLRTVATLPKD